MLPLLLPAPPASHLPQFKELGEVSEGRGVGFDIIPLCLKTNNKSSKPRSASSANKTKFQLQSLSGRRFHSAANGESPHPFLPPPRSKRAPEKRFRCQHALRKSPSRLKVEIGSVQGISRVDAIKGYLNLYFSTSEYPRRVVDEVLASGADFGRGAPKSERIMVEYAQPNTHHSFHIGHHRNTILGESLARIVEFAGFDTIRASYPGDIGLGVITILWAYDKFYKGQEPQGIHERGQWLLKIYAEATAMLEPKENETPEEKAKREAYDAERREMYRKWDTNDQIRARVVVEDARVEFGGIARHPSHSRCEDGCMVF